MSEVLFLRNPSLDRSAAYGPDRLPLTPEGAATAQRAIRSWPGYAPTPLRELPGLASAAGVGRVHYKDESGRFGVGSFKALGGAYGVLRVLQRALAERHGVEAGPADLVSGRYADLTRELVVTCATDGNHGRAVAWGARRFACRAVVYLPEHAHRERGEAIAALGAEVVWVEGSYDDAVDRVLAEAGDRLVVADTGGVGAAVTRDVMHGYTLIVEEALEQLGGEPSTHVFIQAGVGGLAAAVIAPLWWRYGPDRPVSVVVEPTRAACLLAAARAGGPRRLDGAIDSFMGCLAAGEASSAAWPVVGPGADAFLALPDDAARDAMRAMLAGAFGDPPVEVGESGVAGVAGLLAATADPAIRDPLGLGPAARVLLLGTEGPNVAAVRRELADG